MKRAWNDTTPPLSKEVLNRIARKIEGKRDCNIIIYIRSQRVSNIRAIEDDRLERKEETSQKNS